MFEFADNSVSTDIVSIPILKVSSTSPDKAVFELIDNSVFIEKESISIFSSV